MVKKKAQERIQILTKNEIDALYELPTFNQAEREEYFSLDDNILSILKSIGKIESRVYLILLIGYYRAKPVIPKFQLKTVKEDVAYIAQTYFLGKKIKLVTTPKSTRSRLVNKMLSILDAVQFTKENYQDELIERLEDVATICTDSRYIFDECLAFFGQKKIALAGYTTLQHFISDALVIERRRTESILENEILDETLQHLKNILNNKGKLNGLSGYKGSARDFSPTELDRELQTHHTIKTIYPEIKYLIEKLNLSQGNLIYYASMVKHHSIYKLRRYPEWQGLLYLICYLYFRYRETNDKLVMAFCYLVRKHNEAARSAAKLRIADELEVIRNKLKYAGNILRFFVDDDLSDSTKFGVIRKKAFKFISKEEIFMLSQHLDENDFDLKDYEWQYTDKQSKKLSHTIRKLFLAIEIECETGQSILRKQIKSVKTEFLKTGKISTIDKCIIKKSDHVYLIKDTEVDACRFEFYLYRKIYRFIDSGEIYLNESELNKRLDDDLINAVDWKDGKRDIIKKTGLQRLIKPISNSLKDLKNKFDIQLERVTANINADANDFVKRQPSSNQLAWSIANKRWKDEVDNPVYSQIQNIGIIDIMHYVNDKTNFLSALKNISSRKQYVKASTDDLIACIFGNGANYGVHRMASASDRSVGALRTVNDRYIRPETTHASNDIISNEIAKLSIFKHFTINETAPFGSIDGQKHACRMNTFKARYSAKYFKKGKGVSALTLVSNHVPLITKMISPNEYEGHYAFDLLYNNTSDIQPKTLATDTHGVNNVNFAILDMFGYQFAPRIAKFKHAFNELFEIIQGDEIDIQLRKPINEKLIEQEWEQIQHIVCSLSRKTASQSIIIKKLSNNKRNNRILLALREYDRLIKSLYFLEYIDNKTLRHFVQQALNRGEAYHQLRKTIGSINGNQFRGGNDYQIEQWNDCARLIANCIIYYNSALLSVLIERFKKSNDQDMVDMIAGLSPVAWTHILLAGHYTFGSHNTMMNLNEMLENIAISTEKK